MLLRKRGAALLSLGPRLCSIALSISAQALRDVRLLLCCIRGITRGSPRPPSTGTTRCGRVSDALPACFQYGTVPRAVATAPGGATTAIFFKKNL